MLLKDINAEYAVRSVNATQFVLADKVTKRFFSVTDTLNEQIKITEMAVPSDNVDESTDWMPEISDCYITALQELYRREPVASTKYAWQSGGDQVWLVKCIQTNKTYRLTIDTFSAIDQVLTEARPCSRDDDHFYDEIIDSYEGGDINWTCGSTLNTYTFLPMHKYIYDQIESNRILLKNLWTGKVYSLSNDVFTETTEQLENEHKVDNMEGRQLYDTLIESYESHRDSYGGLKLLHPPKYRYTQHGEIFTRYLHVTTGDVYCMYINNGSTWFSRCYWTGQMENAAEVSTEVASDLDKLVLAIKDEAVVKVAFSTLIQIRLAKEPSETETIIREAVEAKTLVESKHDTIYDVANADDGIYIYDTAKNYCYHLYEDNSMCYIDKPKDQEWRKALVTEAKLFYRLAIALHSGLDEEVYDGVTYKLCRYYEGYPAYSHTREPVEMYRDNEKLRYYALVGNTASRTNQPAVNPEWLGVDLEPVWESRLQRVDAILLESAPRPDDADNYRFIHTKDGLYVIDLLNMRSFSLNQTYFAENGDYNQRGTQTLKPAQYFVIDLIKAYYQGETQHDQYVIIQNNNPAYSYHAMAGTDFVYVRDWRKERCFVLVKDQFFVYKNIPQTIGFFKWSHCPDQTIYQWLVEAFDKGEATCTDEEGQVCHICYSSIVEKRFTFSNYRYKNRNNGILLWDVKRHRYFIFSEMVLREHKPTRKGWHPMERNHARFIEQIEAFYKGKKECLGVKLDNDRKPRFSYIQDEDMTVIADWRNDKIYEITEDTPVTELPKWPAFSYEAKWRNGDGTFYGDAVLAYIEGRAVEKKPKQKREYTVYYYGGGIYFVNEKTGAVYNLKDRHFRKADAVEILGLTAIDFHFVKHANLVDLMNDYESGKVTSTSEGMKIRFVRHKRLDKIQTPYAICWKKADFGPVIWRKSDATLYNLTKKNFYPLTNQAVVASYLERDDWEPMENFGEYGALFDTVDEGRVSSIMFRGEEVTVIPSNESRRFDKPRKVTERPVSEAALGSAGTVAMALVEVLKAFGPDSEEGRKAAKSINYLASNVSWQSFGGRGRFENVQPGDENS